jgi:hypothetical protein
MADKSTISDDYREGDNSSEVTSNKLGQYDEVNPKTKEDVNEPQRQENKPITNTITGKISQSLTDAGKEGKNTIRKSFSIGEQDNSSGGIKSIVLGLFALIGFIILVYSIFIAVIGEPLASVADTVFIAALIGSFTLVATIISHLYIKR